MLSCAKFWSLASTSPSFKHIPSAPALSALYKSFPPIVLLVLFPIIRGLDGLASKAPSFSNTLLAVEIRYCSGQNSEFDNGIREEISGWYVFVLVASEPCKTIT